MFDVTKLTARDAYFIGYAEAYQRRIKQIDAENYRFQAVIDKWPESSSAAALKPRLERNIRERKALWAKVGQIMANVRR